MTLVTDMIAYGAEMYLELHGEDVTYTPAAGTSPVTARVAFGAERQDERPMGDAMLRMMVTQIVILRTGENSIAEPRYDDVIARGTSLNREEWQITDFVEQNAACSIVLARKRNRNEATRTGFRSS